MNKQNKGKAYDSINQIINNSLQKFYTSRPSHQPNSQGCDCMKRQSQKAEQMTYYSNQKSMIEEASKALIQTSRSDNQKMIAQLLSMVVDYINKVLELLEQDYLCKCKEAMLTQAKVYRHKIQFMREQNDKFFKLYEEKNLQCQILNKRITELNNKPTDSDIRPLTKRGTLKDSKPNKENEENSSGFELCSQNWSEDRKQSIRSSKISSICQPINPDIKTVFQRDHVIYFKQEIIKKHKKNRIFHEQNSIWQ